MPEYQYTGEGKWYAILNGKRVLIVKGDKFIAQEYEVNAVKGSVTVLTAPGETDGNDMVADEDAGRCKAVHRGFGRYDIINTASGKKLNSQFLSKVEAERFLDSTADMGE